MCASPGAGGADEDRLRAAREGGVDHEEYVAEAVALPLALDEPIDVAQVAVLRRGGW